MIRAWNSGDGELPDRLILSLSDRLGAFRRHPFAAQSLRSGARRRAIRYKSSLVPRCGLSAAVPNAKCKSLQNHTIIAGTMNLRIACLMPATPFQGRNRAGERMANGCDPFGVA
jgi:hypothetical protein